MRRAAELADAALDAAIAETRAGADEGAILAAMHAAIFQGGGDYPGNPFIIGSGRDALLCRYKSGRRRLDRQRPADPRVRRRLPPVPRLPDAHAPGRRSRAHGSARCTPPAARRLLACEARLVPGTPMGAVFDAHAEVLDRHGLRAHRLNACGYSLGATYAPSWMDWPMFFHGNPVEVGARHGVLPAHDPVFDSEAGLAMTLGRTSLVTERGAEPLSRAPLDLIVR